MRGAALTFFGLWSIIGDMMKLNDTEITQEAANERNRLHNLNISYDKFVEEVANLIKMGYPPKNLHEMIRQLTIKWK